MGGNQNPKQARNGHPTDNLLDILTDPVYFYRQDRVILIPNSDGGAIMNDINSYPVVIEMPVAWGDMDAFAHVNNVVYFKYFESGRISYFDKIDFLGFMDKTGIGPILASTSCRYKMPLIYPDTISIGTKVDTIDENSFVMKYAVTSSRHKKIAAIGEGVIVTFDYRNNKKTQIPATIRERIINLEEN